MGVRNLFFIGVLVFQFISCTDDPAVDCSTVMDSYLEINGDRFIFDFVNPPLELRHQYEPLHDVYKIGIDNMDTIVGGYHINDFIGVFLGTSTLREEEYNLVWKEEIHCLNLSLPLESNEAVATIQIYFGDGIFSESGFVYVVDCNGSFVVKMDNIYFSEYECFPDDGNRFEASLQLILE